MQKFDVLIALEGIHEARSKWGVAQAKFNADVEYLMGRLLNEAAVNFMSAEQVANASGLTVKRVRLLMRKHGLDPKRGKRLLAQSAAEALANNAALLGVEPHEMDLMSPLAYLPMGSDLKKFLETMTVSQVHELPDLGERPADCQCCTVVDNVSLAELKAMAVGPLVHGLNYRDDEIGCAVTYDSPVLITSDLSKITCAPCRARLVRA